MYPMNPTAFWGWNLLLIVTIGLFIINIIRYRFAKNNLHNLWLSLTLGANTYVLSILDPRPLFTIYKVIFIIFVVLFAGAALLHALDEKKESRDQDQSKD